MFFNPRIPRRFSCPKSVSGPTMTELSECINLAMEYLAITQTFWRLLERKTFLLSETSVGKMNWQPVVVFEQ